MRATGVGSSNDPGAAGHGRVRAGVARSFQQEVVRMGESERERRQRFETLFDAYSSDIVAYCSWRADSASDAQDAVADVFLTAWRRLDELPEGNAARVWLYTTARRMIANQRRSNRRRVALRERLEFTALPDSQEPASPGREETLVREALRALRPRDREVLLLAEWEGLTPAQIAAVLGCLTVTARGRLHRARRRFREAFEELHAREEGEPLGRSGSELARSRPATALRRHTTAHIGEGGS
jgi:RNA polymerase sigma-70 factor, ECF subfamily